MPLRTLVIGIPLPHVSFDNHSFASAPSISEYKRLIVEMAAVSRVVDEITEGSAEHTNFAGQPIANAGTTARAFGLADLLAMRAREAGHFFAHGGAALCIAHPDAAHEGISGCEQWHRYQWLPEPDAFTYRDALLPGIGESPVELTDPGHPFADYVALYGARMAYRTHLKDSTAPATTRVFARSAGGAAVAFDAPVAGGHIVFVPPLQNPDQDRSGVADTLFQCFERLHDSRQAQPPDAVPKEAP